jgi:hypothetical protein
MRYILMILLMSCNTDNKKIIVNRDIEKPLYDSVMKMLPITEKIIIKKERQIVYKFQEAEKKIVELQKENQKLNELSKITKTVIVRDTIYIKEKTNFWGKKRISTDSSSSIDSTIIEQ